MSIIEKTYPGTKTEILDGNLLTGTTLPEDVVLVIGKAYKGPSNTVYNVSSTKDAILAFGANSPIIKQMQQALTAGAENVALYRIGGQPAVLQNPFGEGTTVSTAESSSTADASLKVFIGPEPLAPSRDALIVYRNDRIVYSNVVGGETDAGVVTVDGFSKTANELYVGSFYDPVPLKSVADEIGKRIIVSETDTAEVTLTGFDESKVSRYGFTVLVNGRRTLRFTRVAGVVTLDADFVATLGSTYTVEVSYIVKLTKDEKEDLELEYKEGQDLINSTWKEYYEAFDTALRELGVANSKAVIIGDVFNVPNVTLGSREVDKLEYVYVEEDEYGERTYEWSADKILYQKDGTETTTDVYEADVSANGEAIIVKRFNAVDFAHRAGMWALEKTEQEGVYPNIVVGAIGPKAYTNKYVTQWVGRLPTFNEEGKLIANGSGLLGHPLMVGSLDNEGGYFATDTGYPDGEVRSDAGGARIDLGRYLSIVVAQVTTGTTVTSGAAAYAGVIASAILGDGTTNNVVTGVANAFNFRANALVDFNNVGYVAFVPKTQGLSVLSGSLASRYTSDYQYVGTSLVINSITREIKEICEPYIGKGIDGTLMVALNGALNTRLAAKQTNGEFISFSTLMSQVGPNTIRVRYRITAKDELREIYNEIIRGREISTLALGN